MGSFKKGTEPFLFSATDQVLEIKFDIGCGARAAYKHVAVGRRVDGLWVIEGLAADERGFAGVTYTGAARPANWNVAGFGELQHALECVGPRYGQAASAE